MVYLNNLFDEKVEAAVNLAKKTLHASHPTLANSLEGNNYFIAPLLSPSGTIVMIDCTKTVYNYRSWEEYTSHSKQIMGLFQMEDSSQGNISEYFH